ncbi:MAG: gamma-glutamylcyclotransferase family protein [Sandaracinaceae bacterium]
MSDWYFAYGANMATRVLRRRGVTAIESHAARLPGHRLVFEEPGIPWLEPAFASLRADDDEVTHGVLHRLTDEDLAALDRIEGIGYDRVAHVVEVPGRGEIAASFYASRRSTTGRRPSRRYIRILVEGAREHDLPARWIERLEAEPTFHVPVWSDAAPVVMRVVEPLIAARHRLRQWARRP